jgi:hypothetical protein
MLARSAFAHFNKKIKPPEYISAATQYACYRGFLMKRRTENADKDTDNFLSR